MKKLISIVTPTFNEEKNIEELSRQIAIQMKNTNYDWRSAFDLYKNSTNVPNFSFQ